MFQHIMTKVQGTWKINCPFNLTIIPTSAGCPYWPIPINIVDKKNACTLKTPRVVAPPFVYGVEYIKISKYRSIEVFMCLFAL